MSPITERRNKLTIEQDWDGLDMVTPGEGASMPDESLFPPIGEYGFLSDCETTALVAPSGNV